MFIEITEYLRCPRPHDPAWLVLAPATMADRHVLEGTLGCPACGAEYPIRDGIARFGTAPALPAAEPALPAVDVVHALLGLASPGGYIALVGSAAGLAAGLGRVMEGVHFVTVNGGRHADPGVTMLEATDSIPLRNRVVRGVVLGGESVAGLVDEAARVVLPGQRVVALTETLAPVEGLEDLARGQGLWVGRKR